MQSLATSRLKQTTAWQVSHSVKTALERMVFNAACRRILKGRFRLVVIAGQKRSGNHAFINWFLSQAHGPCVFFNHVAPDQYPTERHRREFRRNRFGSLPIVAFSYEDRNLNDIRSGALQQFIARHEAQIEDRQMCLILRDPQNLIASRFKKWPEEHQNEDRARGVMAQWTDYAETALARPADLGFALTPVYYNAFITDQAYRDRISDSLGIRRGDRGLNTVSNYGYGSSFDGLTANQSPEKMDIFGRWQSFKNDARFLRLFEDQKITRLAKALEESAKR